MLSEILQKSFESNIWKMYAFKMLVASTFTGSTFTVFLMNNGGLSIAEMLLLQSWFMFCMFALEAPTGAIADRFGRRVSLAIGAVMGIVGWVVYGSTTSLPVFILAEVLLAAAWTCFSGADVALLYDSLKKIGKQKLSKSIIGRMDSFKLLGLVVGTSIGSLIADSFGLNVPLLLNALPFALGLLMILFIKEPKTRIKIESRRYFDILKGGFNFFRRSRPLKALAIDLISVQVVGYYMIWLFQPLLTQSGLEIKYFGLVHAALIIFQIAMINIVPRMDKLLGNKRRFVILSSALAGVMYLLAGLVGWLPLIILSIVVGGGLALCRTPIFFSYMNKHIPSTKRATIISSITMFTSLALMATNSFVGFVADWSLSAVFVSLGVFALLISVFSRARESHLKD